MTETVNSTPIKVLPNKKSGLVPIIVFSFLIFIILTIFFIASMFNDLQAVVKLNFETIQQIHKDIEEMKISKDLLDEVVEAFKNAPKSASEEIIKKANKFEVLKSVYLIKNKLKDSEDIKFELKQIINYPDHSYTLTIKEFLKENLQYLKSNQELIKLIGKLEFNQSEAIRPQSYYQTIKLYFNQLVKVKTTADHKRETQIKQKLTQVISTIQLNNFTRALEIFDSLEIKHPGTEELKKLIQTRVQFDNHMNDLIKNLIQND